MKHYTDKSRDGQEKQKKTCCKTRRVKIDNMKEMSNLICGKVAVGGNYNLTRDILLAEPQKSEEKL